MARFAAAVLSGALVAFTFPDFNVNILAFVALAPLIVAVVLAAGALEALALGTVSSAVTWLINLPWVINVMLHYGGIGPAIGILLFVSLTIVLGLFTGIFFAVVVHRLRLRDSSWRWLLVPVAWMLSEYARMFLFSGFSWNPISVGIIDLRAYVQLARYLGTYVLGALIVLPSTAFAWGVVTRDRKRLLPVFGGVAALMIAWGGTGVWLVKSEESRIATEAKSSAALIQPNISQEMRWSDSSLSEIFQRMTDMTERAITKRAEVVIWPESTVPLTYAKTPVYREYVELTSAVGNVDIILGSIAEDEKDPMKIWNAAYLVSNGKTAGRYDKIKLVPFGEYVPLRKMLFFAEKLVRQVGTFEFGTNDRPLRGKFAYGLAICYEIVFPQIAAAQVRNGADVLVTVTNDAWFGHSAAPTQHLANARMRTIENNRYLLRAATTGISAVIDPTGRVVDSLGLDLQGFIIARFAPRHSRTPYVRFGDWLSLPFILVLAVSLAGEEMKRRKHNEAQRA